MQKSLLINQFCSSQNFSKSCQSFSGAFGLGKIPSSPHNPSWLLLTLLFFSYTLQRQTHLLWQRKNKCIGGSSCCFPALCKGGFIPLFINICYTVLLLLQMAKWEHYKRKLPRPWTACSSLSYPGGGVSGFRLLGNLLLYMCYINSFTFESEMFSDDWPLRKSHKHEHVLLRLGAAWHSATAALYVQGELPSQVLNLLWGTL